MTTDLIAKLRETQIALGDSDGVFAARLGISRTYWVKVRQRKVAPGPQMLGGVLRAFPRLVPLVDEVLLAANVSGETGDGHGRD